MEIELRKPELEDKEKIERYFHMNPSRSCENTFANFYLWSRHYHVSYAFVEDMLIFQGTEGGRYTSFPLGNQEKLKSVIDFLLEWYPKQGLEFHLMNVTPEQFAILEELYPGKFSIEYDRDAADYVYEVEKLINLSGKKYHGKKNHINKFKKLYPNWSYESISKDNVEECFQMALKWRNANGCDEDTGKNAEMCVTLNSLRLFEELNLRGGLIRAEDEIVAFSIGEPVSEDTMVVHIEKAYADVHGAYPMINQQFLIHEAAEYKYVNREEDLGDEGLRKAKESYKPAFLQEKGLVSLKKTD